VSLKKDFARLGAAFDSLTPEQRTTIVAGLSQFSALMGKVRPTLDGIGTNIGAALSPADAKRLSRALKDVGVTMVLGFARGMLVGDPDKAGAAIIAKVRDAIAELPISTSSTFRPLLSPWEG
jgi:hypothetical protein